MYQITHSCANGVYCRPQLLVLTGPPSSRPDLVHFMSHISREVGVMICGEVLVVSGTVNSNNHYVCHKSMTTITYYKVITLRSTEVHDCSLVHVYIVVRENMVIKGMS